MAAAIRPIQAVHRHLNSVVTGMLMSVFAFPIDNLVSMPRDWIARRRASRLAAQLLGLDAWSVTHCKAYASYWGHAARIGRHQSPMRVVLGIRGPRWHWFHSPSTCKALGNWPDHSRLLQLFWESYKDQIDPLFWWEHAAHRNEWKRFAEEFARAKCGTVSGFYQDDQQDLSGRCLARWGNVRATDGQAIFSRRTLPRTFVTEHTGLEESPLHGKWRLTTDGSSTDGARGWAFVIQPPAMPISKAWI